MAIDLPPPPSPVQSELGALRSQTTIQQASVQGVPVYIVGDAALADIDFSRALAAARDASAAVEAVAERVYRAGYPAAQVHYAAAAEALYIGVTLAGVSEVEMPDALARYFDDLAGRPVPLTDEDFERRRLLASLHADRASLAMQPKFESGGSPQRMGLIADASDTEDDATALSVEIGNPGNRFVGRHFVDASVAAGLPSGDRFVARTRDSLRGLNSGDEDSGELHERALEWSRVTPWGLFGLGGRYLSYEAEVPVGDDAFDLDDLLPLPIFGDEDTQVIDGRIWDLEAWWQGVLFADFYKRWTVLLQLDRTGKTIDEDGGERLQREIYNSAEIATDFGGSLLTGARSELGYQLALSTRKGIGNDQDPLSSSDLDYLLWRPQLELEYAHGDHWLYRLRADAQFSGDLVPEQQEWVLGGAGSLDAYLPGVAVGDEGAQARLELAYEAVSALGLDWTPQLFADYAYSKTNDGSAQEVRLADAGIALEASWRERVNARLSYAEGLHDEGLDDDRRERAEADVYFSFGLSF